MSILSFWKSLLPSLGQDRVLDDIARQRDEVENSLLPSLEQSDRFFQHHQFVSSVARSIESAIQHQFKQPHRKLFDLLTSHFKDVVKLLDALEHLVETTFSKDLPKEGMTYRRASVIRLLEIISFAIAYTNHTTLRIIQAEALSGKQDSDANLSDREREYFDSKYQSWLNALITIGRSPEDVVAAIEAIPDVVIDEHNEGAVSSVAGASMDPLRMNVVAPSWNPIYKVRMVLAEWDVATLNRAKEERKLVELRLRALKQTKDGKPDPHLEHAIEVSEDRLKKLDFKIDKLAGVAG